ncbi:MAG: hypothetical protein JJU06_19850 [Ectothiorhodospiraceae bacterium]|nr:hypothetical protein [Ectothiorhodospiraceae bacterium]MCH8504417.1 DUF6316 family protein [Ectothiorhodospiraceae bacterium]
MAASAEGYRSQFRQDRFFHVGESGGLANGWYVETREGVRGPFDSRMEAEDMLSRLVVSHPRRRVSNWHVADSAGNARHV